MKRAILTALVFTTISMPAVPVLAVGEDPLDPLALYEEDGYQGGDYGRVRFQENNVTIVRAATGDLPESEELATLNSPIYPGDSISTYADQRAEVQLAGGTLIRVDAISKVTFQSLPDPYAEYPDNAIVQLSYGAVQLSARVSDKEEFRVDTPAASVYLLGDGDFRVEVDDDGRTRVLSRRGVAEIVSEGGSVLVRGGMRTTVYAGFVPDDPSSFNTFVMDDFDRWVRNREGTYRAPEGHVAAREKEIEPFEDLPTEVKPYYSELSSHGRWVWVADYGYAWYPLGVASSWRPYHRGYWSFGPRGYFWVSYEPWGWAPYHFGRWSWVGGYGWIWIPGSVFSGAWVSWSYGPSYVGWCPLGYYDTPVRAGGIHVGFYGRNSWTFVSYTNLRHRDVHRYSVPVDHVGDEIRRHAVVTRPPKASPRALGNDELSREREFVVARNDRRGRIRSTVEAPRTTFRDNETVVSRRRASNPRRVEQTPGGRTRTSGTAVRVPNPTRPGAPGGGGSRPVQNRTTTASTPPSGGSLSSGGDSAPTSRRRATATPGNRTPLRPADRASRGDRQTTPGVRPPDGEDGTPARRPAADNRSPGARTPGGGQVARPKRETTATEPRGGIRPEADRTPGSRLSPTTRRKQTTTRVRPEGDGSRDAGSSVRDMYEKMSKPRTTERRETPSSKSPSTSARDQAGSRKKESSGSTRRATPRTPSKSNGDRDRSKGTSDGRSKSDRSRSDSSSAKRDNDRSGSSSPDRSSTNRSTRSRSESTSASRSSGSRNRSSGSSASRSSGSRNRSSGSSASRSSGSSSRSSGSSSRSGGGGKSSSSGEKGSGRKR
jgi:hypothetical protein